MGIGPSPVSRRERRTSMSLQRPRPNAVAVRHTGETSSELVCKSGSVVLILALGSAAIRSLPSVIGPGSMDDAGRPAGRCAAAGWHPPPFGGVPIVLARHAILRRPGTGTGPGRDGGADDWCPVGTCPGGCEGVCHVSGRMWGSAIGRVAGTDPGGSPLRDLSDSTRGALLSARAGPVWTWHHGLHLTGAAN